MATVTVDWDVQDAVIPNAATFNQYDVQILNQADNSVVADATVPLGTFEWVFPGIPPGDYLATSVLMDTEGNFGGSQQIAAFTVPTEATAPVVTAIRVSLSADATASAAPKK